MNGLAKSNRPFFLLVDFEMNNPLVIPLEEINPDILLFDFDGFTNAFHGKITTLYKTPEIQAFPLDKNTYSQAFQLVYSHLQRGDSYLTNLTFPVEVQLNKSFADLFHLAKAKYKIVLHGKFLCFSPEIFVQIRDGIITSFPMKGTIDADIPDAETKLLENEKELAEHYTIVDLLRNDLSMVAKQVRVKRFRYIDHLTTNKKHLLQTSSEITGILSGHWQSSLGDIIFSMLPAGSVSGAPKKRTCEIIREAEGCERGYYTGIAGIFDGKNFNSCVLIRFIEQQGEQFFYRAGGGITTQSSCEAEYQELMDKIYVPFI
jgi:para-aminobenzoate synthetase component I